MRSFIYVLSFILGSMAAGAVAARGLAVLNVDGGFRTIEMVETTPPAAAPAGRARIYADETNHALMVSLNGSTYTNLGKRITKLVDEPRINTTTLADDATLLIPVAANQKITFTANIYFSSVSATEDFKFRWQGPAAPSAVSIHCGQGSTSVAFTDSTSVNATYAATEVTVNMGAANVGIAVCEGRVVNGATPGNVAFQWAQSVSGANAITVLAASWIEYDWL